jgi:hypothetical protein
VEIRECAIFFNSRESKKVSETRTKMGWMIWSEEERPGSRGAARGEERTGLDGGCRGM